MNSFHITKAAGNSQLSKSSQIKVWEYKRSEISWLNDYEQSSSGQPGKPERAFVSCLCFNNDNTRDVTRALLVQHRNEQMTSGSNVSQL